MTKGSIIKVVKTNDKITEANSVEYVEVVRVNQKTYTVKSLDYGYGYKITKEALNNTYIDVYGTITKYEAI